MLTRLANRARATSLHIDRVDPVLQQCGSFTFRWTGGTGPYTLPIRVTNETALREPSLGNQHEELYVWDPVDVQGGTSLYAEVLDSTGQRDATAAFQIQESSDSGCLALVRHSFTSRRRCMVVEARRGNPTLDLVCIVDFPLYW